MKVDMFKDILPAINKGDKNFYNKLPLEARKSSVINYWMIHRWATCPKKNKEHYIMFVNELCNNHYSDISNHPELQWLLLSVIGVGPEKYFKEWVGTPNSRQKESSIDKFLLEVYPTISDDELNLLKEMNTENDFQNLAKEMGYSDKQISDIFDGKRRSKKS
tara:strand:- start:245 stop:730 length:486 start_codon:yes stop_codon:yes gene_type:complete